MKKLALLLLCLIANSSCLYMTIVSPEQYHVLTPEVNEDSYFYLLTENFFSTAKVYLYFRDQRSHFKYNELEICYTDENPKSKTAVSNCRFRWINYYRATTDKNGDKYYYSFDYYDRYSIKQLYKKYIIVHFKTDKQYSQGPILTVKASTKDIYNEESNKDVQKFFSIIYVIFSLEYAFYSVFHFLSQIRTDTFSYHISQVLIPASPLPDGLPLDITLARQKFHYFVS